MKHFLFTCLIASCGLTLSAQTATNARSGRFSRGTGSDPTYHSFVIPVDFQKGVSIPLMGFEIVGSNYFPYNTWRGVLKHLNATNTGSPLTFENQIVAFGSRAGGSPLYFNRSYTFGIYAGGTSPDQDSALRIAVYDLNYTNVGLINIPIPKLSNTNDWNSYVTNGYTKTITAFNLTTVLHFNPAVQTWGARYAGQLHLTHIATPGPTNYIYQVELGGSTDLGYTVKNFANFVPDWSRLYTVEFEQKPSWRSVFIHQPHFQGEPLPPAYEGKSVEEILTNTPPVTNIVSLPDAPNTYTNIDQSPELRRHPILDQFVTDMRRDPIALTSYVFNEIELTDAVAWNDNGSINDESINLGGVNRSALGTFLEGQGSPSEQCSLLVYLLRQAGYPAVYIFPPENGMKMLDARLSKLLRFQFKGAVKNDGTTWTTNRLIPVNYPWVATYVSNQWVHVFPWIKDYEITEGFGVWDFMPANYNNAYKWVRGFLFGDTNITSLATEQSPAALFPKWAERSLMTNGLSLDDMGVQIFNRRNQYARWSDFPCPTSVTNTSIAVESFASTAITNVSPNLTNIFDTIRVEVFSNVATNKKVDTGTLRMADLHNRRLLLRHEKIDASNHRMVLTLQSYRLGLTTTNSFSNDAALLNPQRAATNLTTTDDFLTIRLTYNRHRAYTGGTDSPGFLNIGEVNRPVTEERTIRKGDLVALGFDVGRVTKRMLQVHAQEYWNLEQQLQSNPSLTNSLSPDLFQGGLAYLLGLVYYERLNRFQQFNAALHKEHILSNFRSGLVKFAARRVSGSLPNGDIDLIRPHIDIFDYTTAFIGNQTVHPDSGEDILAGDDFALLDMANASAQEHAVLNSYLREQDAVSTVRLLQLAQARSGPGTNGIVTLTKTNYVAEGNKNQPTSSGAPLRSHDTNIWKTVTNSFTVAAYGDHTQVLMTPGSVTNLSGSFNGVGALLIQPGNAYGALISGNLNGGSASLFPNNALSPPNALNLHVWNEDGNYYFTYFSPASTRTVAPDSPASFLFQSVINNANNNYYQITDFQNAYGDWNSRLLNGTPGTFPAGASAENQIGNNGAANNHLTIGQMFADPVSAITGEFYIDTTDLRLPGPMPLTVRRNYSSQNLANNQFGFGWKLAYMPFLTVNSSNVIYASEMDGTVVAYDFSGNETWLPSLTRNPHLNNFTTAGVGSTANLFRGKVVREVVGPDTFYKLYSPDGSLRTFKVMTFGSPLNTTRPYLTTWQDAQGNSYTFEYGLDSTQPDYGEVRRIQSSNGNFIGFYYDVYGHVTEAYAGDGRRLAYGYDEFGDLVRVTLPDASEINYEYEHKFQSVTNGPNVTQQPYSTHLVIKEIKPDGRTLANQYDQHRRVTNQFSTVAADLSLVRNATFIYSNNFTLTGAITSSISGYTLLVDVNNKTNRFDYQNSLIRFTTNAVGLTSECQYYADNATAPGYPRSLFKKRDERGLWSEFQYDSAGNVTNTIVTGDLTGDGILTQTATNSVSYNSNSLPVEVTDPFGNKTKYGYHSTFPFLPETITRFAGGTPISTNKFDYYNVTNVFTGGGVTFTNIAFGVLQRETRAFGSTDAATTEWTRDGRGFITQQIQFTGTADPAVTNTFLYNWRGELVEKVDAAGRRTRLDYDGLGRLKTREIYEAGTTVPLTWDYSYYNPNGDLVWSDGPRFDPEDYIWRDYDGAGRLCSEIRWRSRAKVDGSGVEAETGDNLYSTSFNEYDTFGNLRKVIDARRNYQQMDYDAIGRLIERRFYEGTNDLLLAKEGFAYEPGGQVQYATNALLGVTTNFYTTNGKLRTRITPDGATNQWRYHLDGRVQKEILSNGSYWLYEYGDANRRVTRRFYSSGNTLLATETKDFDRRGNLVTLTDVDGHVFQTTYDGLDRKKMALGPPTVSGSSDQQTTIYVYDGAGVTLEVRNLLSEKTVTTFDAAGRALTVQTFTAGGTPIRYTATSYAATEHSATVTEGTSNPVTTTTYTDTFGKTVLNVRTPTAGRSEFIRNVYDNGGQLVQTVEAANISGAVTTFGSTSFEHDGLNRMTRQVKNDTEAITFAYNAAGSLTNRAMPGSLTWRASYDSANRITSEVLSGVGGATTRSFTYSYFTSGPSIGLLQTVSDPRGITISKGYDAFLRLTTNNSSGGQTAFNSSTLYQYDNNGRVTWLGQSVSGQSTTGVSRQYDGYGQIIAEDVYIDGVIQREVNQRWDAAGRRNQLAAEPTFPQGPGLGRTVDFGYRADGVMTSVQPAGSTAYSYGYGDNGLLNSRSTGFRTTTVGSRDGTGRPLSITTAVPGAGNPLVETLTWRGDGRLTNYLATRSDFTDTHRYDYNYNQVNRLTSETLLLGAGQNLATNRYVYDYGANGGPGVLTSNAMSGGAYYTRWYAPSSGRTGLDLFQRILNEYEDSVARRSATGGVAGVSFVTLLAHGKTNKNVDYYTNSGKWRACIELPKGTNHAITVRAHHPSGQIIASRTNTYSVSSFDYQATTYDAAGFITQRVLRADTGQNTAIQRTQTLTWDAWGRLVTVTERDDVNDGYDWVGTYDGLGRLLRTTYTPVSANVANANFRVTVDSWYDPQVEFLEIGVAVNGQRWWKIYGPDISGRYGAMQGAGGMESAISEINTALSRGILNDYFGNALAHTVSPQVRWTAARFNGYGPVPGSPAAYLDRNVTIAEAVSWRGWRLHPMGWYNHGARWYDPNASRYLSFDPAWEISGNIDPYGYSSDPINFIDPTGRFGTRLAYDVRGVGAVLTDAAINIIPGTAALANWLAGAAAELTHPVLGIPYQDFYNSMEQWQSRMSPYAQAGFYDPNSQAAQTLAAATIFVAPESLMGRTGSGARLVVAEEQTIWMVTRHGDMPTPRPAGTQSHHGVNSVWMDANVPGYSASEAPAILMQNEPFHNATRGVFNRIRTEIAERQGVSPRNIDWSQVPPGTAWRLAEEQLQAAQVPPHIQAEYFRQLNEYLNSLRR
jgi:RHS repeat-associated protein